MRAEQIAYLGNGYIFEYSIANHIPSEFTFETVLIAENRKLFMLPFSFLTKRSLYFEPILLLEMFFC